VYVYHRSIVAQSGETIKKLLLIDGSLDVQMSLLGLLEGKNAAIVHTYELRLKIGNGVINMPGTVHSSSLYGVQTSKSLACTHNTSTRASIPF